MSTCSCPTNGHGHASWCERSNPSPRTLSVDDIRKINKELEARSVTPDADGKIPFPVHPDSPLARMAKEAHMKHHGHEYGQNDENQIYGPAHAPRMKWTCSGCSKRNDSKLFAGCTSILLPCRHCKKVTHFLATSKGVEGERNQEPTPNPDDALEQL